MSRHPFRFVLFAAIASLALPALADAPADPRALLRRVESTYRGLAAYDVRGTVVLHMTSGDQKQTYDLPVHAAASGSARSRTEMIHPTMGMKLFTDSTHTIIYAAQSNTYTRKAAVQTPLGAAGGPAGSPLSRYFSITSELRGARHVGREPVVMNGAPVLCDVIEAVYPAPASMGADSSTQAYTTYWIEPSSAIVLRDSMFIRIENTTSGKPLEMVQTSRYPSVSIGQAIPDSMWVFTPPPGAKEVEDFRGAQPERPNLTGQQAAAFSLADLAGKTRTLASYKGKVVMLDFWATWCGPCRVTMPHVQKFHRELRSKGLVVLGINIGESAAKVRPFLAKNGYDFPVLLDPKHAVAERYKANAIPTTVIIDRKGKIVAYFTGVKSEEELRAGLKKAGL